MEDEKTEAELLKAVMENSPIMEEADIPPPPPEDEAEEEVVEDESEDIEEDVEEEEEPEEESDGPEELGEDEVDWDTTVPVTIDGEVHQVSLSELRKGYATDQHLSAKGREIGEAAKQVDEYRQQKLQEIEGMAFSLNEIMGATEKNLAQEYHAIDAQINEARSEGDTYRVQELKDQREIAQQRYWQARQQREGTLAQVAQAKEQMENEQWNQKVQEFYDGITQVIPEYNEEYAETLREFGRNEGISQEYMMSITDPTIVRVLDDYRKLKEGVSTGAKKREKAPIKKAPKKKSRTANQKKASKENLVKARAMREDASSEDQMDFLRQHAARTLGLDT